MIPHQHKPKTNTTALATKLKAASGKGRSTSFVCHENACFRAGQIVTIQGIEHKIKTVTPTRISRDSYGSEVDWSGFEIGAVRC